MKKLIALFAILVAMTSFSFAANSASATATVNVWNKMTVNITIDDTFTDPANILVGGEVTIPFKLEVTADANDWTASVNSITATHGTISASAFVTGSGNGDATENLSVTYTNDGTAGQQTVTATYTAQYDNL